MNRVVRLRAEAERDLRAAVGWYDGEREGLGADLLADVDRALASVARGPARFPLVVPPFRRALLARFPYAIYFRETDDSVQVFAVFHARRDPRDLSERLAE